MRIGSVFGLAVAAVLALPAPAARAQAAAPQSVGAGDVLQIMVYAGGEKQEDFDATVSPRGTIVCPLLGEFDLGTTRTQTTEIATKLQQALARDYYVDPQVLVNVRQYGGKVFLLGEVRRPGAYTLSEAPTVLSACATAGGWTDFASPRRAKIARIEDGKARVIVVDLLKVRQGRAEDLPLQNGDHVEIPRRLF